MWEGLIYLVVEEYREFSGLVECSRGIFSSLCFLFFCSKKKIRGREKKN